MTVLTIAQNVARGTGFTAPSSLVGNADELAIQLLQLIRDETFDLSNGIIPGEDMPSDFYWQALVKRGTFNFVNAQENYTFPTDFNTYIQKTMWNFTTRRPVITPINAEDYEIQKNYLISSAINKMIYVYGNQMVVTPVPTSTDTINYEYTSTYIYQSSGGSGKTDITLDTDVTTISEKLVQLGVKLRFLVAKGLIPSATFQTSFEYQNYMASVQRAMLKDGFGSKNPINMNGGRSRYWLAASTQDCDFPSS